MNHDQRTYSEGFYTYIEGGSIRSARIVLKHVLSALTVNSVLDVGSGRGAWLSVFEELGVAELRGVDGDYVAPSTFLVAPECFTASNLEQPLSVGRQFDLVVSLEVAEHLPPDSAGTFVRSLTDHGDLILFSAATPGQGGEHHVNEQRLRYWQRKFEAAGFVAFDFVRPLVADDRNVEPWYRYNTLLYVRDSVSGAIPDVITSTRVHGEVEDGGSVSWRVRKLVGRLLPTWAATAVAQGLAKATNIRLRLKRKRIGERA